MDRTAGQHGQTGRLDRDLCGLDPCTRLVQIGQVGNRGLGLFQPTPRRHRLVFKPNNRQFGRLELTTDYRHLGLGAGGGAIGLGHALICCAAGVAGHLIGPRQIGQTGLQRLMRATRPFGCRGHLFQIAL